MDRPLPQKSLGQHWLDDRTTLEAIAAAAEIKAQDTVLEIGPGLGTLTAVLTRQAGQVIAVEVDPQLATELPQRVPAHNLHVVQQDILRFDLTNLPTAYKIVANIPYYLTNNLLRTLSESPNPPHTAVLLVQQEVAERVAAKPGSMSLLSVMAQFYWQVSLGQHVPATLFIPPPKVDSQVLILHYRLEPLFKRVDPRLFFRLVKAGFAQRRKTLLNSLSSGLQLDKKTITTMCASVGIDPKRRAQTLSLTEWHNLYLSYNT